MARTYVTVDVDVDISDVLDGLSDDEWVDILKETDNKTLAKAGLQRIPDERMDSLTEHLTLVRATRKGRAA